MQKGQIFKIHSDFYYVKSEDILFECKLREVLKKQRQKVFVGDFVEFANGAIEKIIERKNYIPRPSVANIDNILIVSAVKEPELDFVQLDRYIAFSKYFKIPAILCFNKNDLSENDKLIEKVFSIYEPLGYDILFTSAKEGYGIEEFKKLIQNKTTVMCGTSGVGKTSLINTVFPNKNLRVGDVSSKTKRGTHTTRHCEIINICKNTNIVDTPGFSNLKFDFLMPEKISSLFNEISSFNGKCKYQNCLHLNETDCAVKEAAILKDTRYESYKAFVEEALTYKEKVKYSGLKEEKNVKINKSKAYTKISSKKREAARNTQKQNINKGFDYENFD